MACVWCVRASLWLPWLWAGPRPHPCLSVEAWGCPAVGSVSWGALFLALPTWGRVPGLLGCPRLCPSKSAFSLRWGPQLSILRDTGVCRGQCACERGACFPARKQPSCDSHPAGPAFLILPRASRRRRSGAEWGRKLKGHWE